jgi:hypothetical protein
MPASSWLEQGLTLHSIAPPGADVPFPRQARTQRLAH